jgi:hypothetical protein
MSDLETKVYDGLHDDVEGTEISVTEMPNHIAISIAGHGDSLSNNDAGVPVIIEKYDGEFRVVIWGDINQEDPTHIISLADTKVEKKVEDE